MLTPTCSWNSRVRVFEHSSAPSPTPGLTASGLQLARSHTLRDTRTFLPASLPHVWVLEHERDRRLALSGVVLTPTRALLDELEGGSHLIHVTAPATIKAYPVLEVQSCVCRLLGISSCPVSHR